MKVIVDIIVFTLAFLCVDSKLAIQTVIEVFKKNKDVCQQIVSSEKITVLGFYIMYSVNSV